MITETNASILLAIYVVAAVGCAMFEREYGHIDELQKLIRNTPNLMFPLGVLVLGLWLATHLRPGLD